MKKVIFAILSIAILHVNAMAAESIYVQSAKAKIYSEPNFKSDVKAEAKRGDSFSLIEKKGRWYKVGLSNDQGWINALVASENPPMNRVKVLTEASKDIGKSSRKRASAITSAAAARGLSDEDRKRLSQEGKANYSSLEKLEAFASGISEKEVDEFSGAGAL